MMPEKILATLCVVAALLLAPGSPSIKECRAQGCQELSDDRCVRCDDGE